jgi:hypothetical protein
LTNPLPNRTARVYPWNPRFMMVRTRALGPRCIDLDNRNIIERTPGNNSRGKCKETRPRKKRKGVQRYNQGTERDGEGWTV